MRYFLFWLIFLVLAGGCEKHDKRYAYLLEGHVWWGEKLAINSPVEVSEPLYPFGVDTVFTDTTGWYSYVWEYHYDEVFSYKVRAMDSTGCWSPYKQGEVEPNGIEVVDFHL